ncbi:hypothetical protein ERO13_D01G103650v2, partial [Gossypium hirsutum]
SLPFRDAIDAFYLSLCTFPRCIALYSFNQWLFPTPESFITNFIIFLFYHLSSFTTLKIFPFASYFISSISQFNNFPVSIFTSSL